VVGRVASMRIYGDAVFVNVKRICPTLDAIVKWNEE
jgi:hypothetical protein